MKTVAQHISQGVGQQLSQQGARQRSTQTERKQRPQLDGKLLDRLFVRLNSTYGHLWSSRYPYPELLQAAKAEWAIELAGVSKRQLEQALKACKRSYPKGPTLPEFRELCRPKQCAAHRQYQALPKPKGDKETAAKHLAAMKAKLKGRNAA